MTLRLVQAATLLVFAVGCSASTTGGATGGGGGGGSGGGTAAGGGVGGGGGAAGGGGGSGGGFVFVGDAGTYACDVQPIIQSRCLDCHTNPPQFGALMPLVTWQDTHANSTRVPGQKIFQRMAERVADMAAPMPQQPNLPLTPAQISAFKNWAAGGAAQGDPAACGNRPDAGMDAGVVDAGNPDDCPPGSTELLITAPAFTIPSATDFYQCFAQTVVLPPGKQHIIQATKVIGDARVLHHMVLFRDLGKNAAAQIANCGVQQDWTVLYAWAPGAGPMVLPSDIGMPINNGDQMVIQIHYNNATAVNGTDSSGAKLCLTTTLRPKEGGVIAVGPQKFQLPPNCPKATVAADCTNLSFLNTS